MSRKNQSGISVGEIVLVLAVIGLMGALGYMFYANQIEPPDSEQQAQTSDVPVAPEVNSTDDLDKASTTLDQTDPETSSSQDASQLERESSGL